jgi:hypothetical protein
MTSQPFYAIRVTLYDETGSIVERDYVRGETRMGRARFAAFALGDLILITRGDSSIENWFRHDIRELAPSEVYQRRSELAR